MSHRASIKAVVVLAALVAAGVVWFSATSMALSSGSGMWVPTATNDCDDPNLTCAEWETQDDPPPILSAFPCCIPPSRLYSTTDGACESEFRHGH